MDIIYDYLDDNLSAGHYELVDNLLLEIMNNEIFWQKGIEYAEFSLPFAIFIHHEPKKFKNREQFLKKLHTDYVSKHGAAKGANLLQGLMKL